MIFFKKRGIKNNEILEKNDFTLFDKIVCIYIFIDLFLLTSSLLLYFLPKTLLIFAFRLSFYGIAAYVVFRRGSFHVKKYLVVAICLIALGAVVSFFRHGADVPIWYLGIFRIIIFTFILLSFCKERHLGAVANMGTVFFIMLLVGAFIGFSYALAGGAPIFSFPNPDTRINELFLTTCTNMKLGNIIRPSGIYDEPGTFSFFLCILAVFRVLTGKNDVLTFFMLLMGNITFSMAHIIFFALYIMYMLVKYYKKKLFLIYIALVVSVVSFMLYQYQDVWNEMMARRLQVDYITKNNRTELVDNSLSRLKSANSFTDIILFGDPKVGETVFVAANPLGPLVERGIFVAWIFYMCMLILLLGGAISKQYSFVFWAVVAIFLQRPYFLTIGYATVLYMITAIVINMTYSRMKKIL